MFAMTAPAQATDPSSTRREPLAAKVPEIAIMFWIIKILTTGMGEATSDYLGNTNLVLAGIIGVGGFALALWLQLRVRHYIAVVYWFAVIMVAVFGTIMADGIHIIGVPYALSTTFYAIVLAAVFYLWHRNEGTLSIHSIITRRREIYYWCTVLATFALGTAAGDLTASQMNLGFFTSGIIFTIAILLPLIAWILGLNAIVAFWIAYVLTRPLGASFADWLGKEHNIGGGLGYGDGTVAGIALAIIAILVAYTAITRNDIQPPAAVAAEVAEENSAVAA
jgi:uncharacterized membrane-anchored protein